VDTDVYALIFSEIIKKIPSLIPVWNGLYKNSKFFFYLLQDRTVVIFNRNQTFSGIVDLKYNSFLNHLIQF